VNEPIALLIARALSIRAAGLPPGGYRKQNQSFSQVAELQRAWQAGRRSDCRQQKTDSCG